MNKCAFIKKRYIMLTALYTVFLLSIKAQQNMINNPSFEDTIYCEITGTDLLQFKNWYKPHLNSVFTQNYCNINYLFPRTGYACVLGTSYYFGTGEQFSYIANKFKDTLKTNVTYCFSLYLKLYNKVKYGSNNLGVFFDNTHINYSTFFLVPASPIATLNTTIIDTIYQKFSFSYTALGGETDFMVGGYVPYGNANYPLIFPSAPNNGSWFVYDDFSLISSDIDLGNDTTICAESDSLLLGEPNWVETNYKWYANGILIDSINGQIKVKPNSTTTYIVQKQTSCTTSYDTLILSFTGTCPIPPSDIKEPIIPNVFSPNGDDVNEFWKITLPPGAKLNYLEVCNRWGNIVFTSMGTIKPWFGKTTSGEVCSEGVYFFILRYTDTKGEEQKKNGYISLFK